MIIRFYGECTSFNLAALNLNDDVSEPVRINFGMRRSVAAVAPRRGGAAQELEVEGSGGKKIKVTARGGDAVSVFCNFDLDYLANRKDATLPPKIELPLAADNLNIRTRFASGQAAIEIAGEPEVVNAILGMRPVVPDTRKTIGEKETLGV